MAEILAVTWGEQDLALRRVPSEGIWNKDAKLLKRVSLQRPTRAGRLTHPEIGGALGSALTELFADVDVNVPCWLLLPNNWILRFVSEPPDLKSQELTLNQLRWESIQRISGDPADYKISAALMMGGSRYYICITRSEVIQRCLNAAETADLELAGIGLEPDPNENYTFEHPLDLRDALPLELENTPGKSVGKKKTSPALIGIFIVIVAAVGGYLYYSSQPAPVKKPVAQRATQKPMSATEAITPPTTELLATASSDTLAAKPESQTEAPVTTPEVQEKVAETPAKVAETIPAPKESPLVERSVPATHTRTVSTGSSIIRSLFIGLPAGSKAEMVILSPVDLKIEASGVGNPEQWVATLKKQSGWGNVKLVANYETVVGKVVSVRVENPGWGVVEGKPSAKWQELAKSAGMSVRDHTATGKLESALTLIDQLWKDSNGLSKIYLTPVGDNWQVVVQ